MAKTRYIVDDRAEIDTVGGRLGFVCRLLDEARARLDECDAKIRASGLTSLGGLEAAERALGHADGKVSEARRHLHTAQGWLAHEQRRGSDN